MKRALVFSCIMITLLCFTQNREVHAKFEHKVDSIDQTTGEEWLDEGVPPPRVNYLSTPFYNSLSDKDLWHELEQIEPVAVVGLKLPHLFRGVFRGRVLIEPEDIELIRGKLLSLDGIDEYVSDEKYSLPTMLDGKSYPVLFLRVHTIQALSTLRTLDIVDFVEPLYFYDGIGCGNPEYIPNINDEHFTPAPGHQSQDLVPWSFSHMSISEAWRLFNNGFGTITDPGRGIKIGVVDTGTYATQSQLNSLRFPLPSGTRRVDHFSVRADPTVYCSHGTRIAGLATAPADGRNSSGGTTVVGVAWGSDLVTVKIGNGVVHASGTSQAIVAGLDLAVAQGARVITMAFGMPWPFASNFVADNITRIFDANPNVILVGAAGTSTGSVVFPATMTREVVSVSIVDFKPDRNGRYQLMNFGSYGFDQVAYGPEVDFVTVSSVEGISTTGNPLEADTTTVGGSSSATAHIAGIFALVWSRQPNLTRADVIAQLARSSSIRSIAYQQRYFSVGKSLEVGWGIPDTYIAAGGIRRASIIGPSNVAPQSTYTLVASSDSDEVFGNYRTYLWDTGETTKSITVTAGLSGSRTHRVTIVNHPDLRMLKAEQTVEFSGGKHRRILYSEKMVSEWASFLFGKRVDIFVNLGQQMIPGCSVISLSGLEYDYLPTTLQPVGVPVPNKDNGYNGFSISKFGGFPSQDLTAIVHVWHNGVSAIRVRVVYDLWERDGVDCLIPGVTRIRP